jgi:hypothetical protein
MGTGRVDVTPVSFAYGHPRRPDQRICPVRLVKDTVGDMSK